MNFRVLLTFNFYQSSYGMKILSRLSAMCSYVTPLHLEISLAVCLSFSCILT